MFAATIAGYVAVVDLLLLVITVLAVRWAKANISRGFRVLSVLVPLSGFILCIAVITFEFPLIGLGFGAIAWCLVRLAPTRRRAPLAFCALVFLNLPVQAAAIWFIAYWVHVATLCGSHLEGIGPQALFGVYVVAPRLHVLRALAVGVAGAESLLLAGTAAMTWCRRQQFSKRTIVALLALPTVGLGLSLICILRVGLPS